MVLHRGRSQKFLARLVVQVARGRVSPLRAAVSATSPALHSHRAMDCESENDSEQTIFDLPRHKRD